VHAFIVRPFGSKKGVNFDQVESELIAPALDRLDMSGRTTAEITRAGNIRADMFHLLLSADIVIADISIHNANVFYELGVRHALRDKRTFLLRAGIDEVPFDLKTDRYLSYDPRNPGACLDALIEGLAETKRNDGVDSPVYSMVPGLRAPDPSGFIVVPQDFREEVARARATKQRGDLRFLAAELAGLPWRREGLRLVAEAQFTLRDLRQSAENWELVRAEVLADAQANLRLGTCYQKLNEPVLSDEALQRVVSLKGLDSETLAEACALLGSNAKTRWLSDWRQPSQQTRQVEALRSAHLFDAQQEYCRGFEAEPRHCYSGLNALALVTVVIKLAEAQPDVWRERFVDEDEAAFRLREQRTLRAQLAGAVEFSLRARQQQLARNDDTNPWLALSCADLAFLLEKPNVRQAYRDALGKLDPFAVEVARRQFDIFESLGILQKSVEAVASLFHAQQYPAAAAVPKVLLFTGHRIDHPDRAKPRFPANQETTARAAIRKAIEQELPSSSPVIGIAGGASGGDLLFHEVCEEFGVERRLYLIIPRDEYVEASVAPSGANWIARFNHQHETAQCREYQRSKDLPLWLAEKPDYSVWQRSNLWTLHNALATGGANTTLIALWNREGGDGPGGTEHMVKSAEDHGAGTVILDINQLFGL
jgi:hypothetical protein